MRHDKAWWLLDDKIFIPMQRRYAAVFREAGLPPPTQIETARWVWEFPGTGEVVATFNSDHFDLRGRWLRGAPREGVTQLHKQMVRALRAESYGFLACWLLYVAVGALSYCLITPLFANGLALGCLLTIVLRRTLEDYRSP